MGELQTICYGKPDALQKFAVEYSLRLSKNLDIKSLLSYLDDVSKPKAITIRSEHVILEEAIRTVFIIKKINSKAHPDFAKAFGKCVELISSYRQLYMECEELRQTQYDSENQVHEGLLLRLWDLLMPYDPLDARITKQWQVIGFQGDDPKTDFIGMGILGLENLVYFAQEYTSAATHVLSHSMYLRLGYAFAHCCHKFDECGAAIVKRWISQNSHIQFSKNLFTINSCLSSILLLFSLF